MNIAPIEIEYEKYGASIVNCQIKSEHLLKLLNCSIKNEGKIETANK